MDAGSLIATLPQFSAPWCLFLSHGACVLLLYCLPLSPTRPVSSCLSLLSPNLKMLHLIRTQLSTEPSTPISGQVYVPSEPSTSCSLAIATISFSHSSLIAQCIYNNVLRVSSFHYLCVNFSSILPSLSLINVLPPLSLYFPPCCPHLIHISPPFTSSFILLSFMPALSVSHGVLAKLVAELLDEKSQLSSGLGLLFKELITEAGNVLLDLF